MGKFPSQTKLNLVSILIIMIVSISIYANTLNNGFVSDDSYVIVDNSFIKNFENLPQLFTKAYLIFSGEMSYRPVVTFSYFLDNSLYDLKPWGFHLTNILIHTTNGILLYLLICLLIKQSVAENRNLEFNKSAPLALEPLIISLLFVTNPVLTEAVNSIGFREDLLAFMFYTATLCLYLVVRLYSTHHFTKVIVYTVSCLIYFIALLSKEMAATLPFVIYLYEWIFEINKKRTLQFILNYYNIGYIIVTCLYLYIRFFCFYNTAEKDYPTWSVAEGIFTTPWLLLKYMIITLLPINLSIDYVINPVKSLFSSSFGFPFAMVVFLLTLLFLFKEKNKLIAFGAFFFIITLLPVYNIIPTNIHFAERFLYIPVAGFATFAGSFLLTILNAWAKPITKKPHLIAFLVLLMILSAYTFAVVKRNKVWQNNYLLALDTVKKTPNSSRFRGGLGDAYFEMGRFEDAIREYKIAQENSLDCSFASTYKGSARYCAITHNNLGCAYSETSRFDEAIQEFMASAKIDPSYPESYYNLGIIYNKIGQIDKAINEYQLTLMHNPSHIGANYNLGLIFSRMGKIDEAIRLFQNVLKLDPKSFEVNDYLDKLYQKKTINKS